MWPQKPLEYWAVLIGMVLYAAARDAQREPLWTRAVKVFASAFLTFGLSPTIAPYLRGSETAAAVAVMAFGLLALDALMVCLGVWYGPAWWPAAMLACCGVVMVSRAVRL